MTRKFNMNMNKIARNGLSAACALGMWAGGAYAADMDPLIRSYESPTGDTFGSLSLSAPKSTQVAGKTDHVVLIDTSASQVGEHRVRSLEVLESFLKSLPAADRVQVIAIDVRTAAMTDGMVPASTAATQALARLQKRFPAGSSDLQQGLMEAAAALTSSERGSILYIGDGMSAAHLIQTEEMVSLTQMLRQQHLPVHSYGVGSNMDMRLLGIVGAETGGYVMRDERSEKALTGTDAGKLLAEASHRIVIYPASLQLAGNELSLLPNRPLPLRSDRETVFLTQGEFSPTSKLSMQAGGDTLTWDLSLIDRSTGNTFLTHMWSEGSANDGISNGLAGDWMVSLAQQAFEDSVAVMEAQGVQALQAGEAKVAENIGFQLQSVDPNNAHAPVLINKAGELQFTQAQVEPPLAGREGPVEGGAISNFEAERIARGQRLSREVEARIQEATAIVETQPDAAADILERTNGAIKAEQGKIDAELANQLLRRVNSSITDLQSRRRAIESQIQLRQRKQAEKEAQQRLLDYAAERDRTLEQYVERARSLMAEGYRGNPLAFEEAEKVARRAASDFPGASTPNAMVFVAEAAQQLDRAERLRMLRSDKFVETLYQTELSHVPFPDNPAIVYPDPQWWQEITERRVKRWSDVDLYRKSPNEENIYQQLDEQTNLAFPGNPLSDVIQYISDLHRIPIRLETQILEDAGVAIDTEVDLVISNVSLRSALKLLLENVNGVALTYVVEDEVMKITTVEAAEEKLQTRVYQVADLVIQITPLAGGFGTGGGGGFGGGGGGFGGGGQGGFGGGQGGGGFGGGGGGFGGGQGGGGGFFSVPSNVNPADLGKKKPLK